MLIIIMGAGSLLRFYHIGQLSFWLDEADTFFISKGDLTHLVTAIINEPNMCLYFVLSNLWIKIFPDASDGTLRALSAIISIASIPVVFMLGSAMTSNRKRATGIGLIAAFLVAFNAFHIQYAQEFRSYSLIFLLTALSTLLLIKAVEATELKNRWLTGYVLTAAAAVYCHLHVVFIILAQVVTLPILFLDKEKHPIRFKQILYGGICMVGLISPIFILSSLKGPKEISWIPEPTFTTLKEFLVQITGKQGMFLAALYLLFGSIGLLYGSGEGFLLKQNTLTRWKFSLVASCFLIPTIAVFLISKNLIPLFTDRYLMFVMPYLTVAAASGIVAISHFRYTSKPGKPMPVPIGILVFVLFAVLSAKGIWFYYHKNQKEDWRDATLFLKEKCSDSLRIYYPAFIEKCVLYYNPSLQSQGPAWPKHILKASPAADEFSTLISPKYNQTCVVLSDINFDQRKSQAEMIGTVIKKEFPYESAIEFNGVEIRIYKRFGN